MQRYFPAQFVLNRTWKRSTGDHCQLFVNFLFFEFQSPFEIASLRLISTRLRDSPSLRRDMAFKIREVGVGLERIAPTVGNNLWRDDMNFAHHPRIKARFRKNFRHDLV